MHVLIYGNETCNSFYSLELGIILLQESGNFLGGISQLKDRFLVLSRYVLQGGRDFLEQLVGGGGQVVDLGPDLSQHALHDGEQSVSRSSDAGHL